VKDTIVRAATRADLAAVGAIWKANVMPTGSAAPSAPEMPSLYFHELEQGELHVAERGGQVLGFAAAIRREASTFLADLFVLPGHQSAGLGVALLRHVMPREGSLRCTASSSDPRAQALYIRWGMRPRWPLFHLLTDPRRLGVGPPPRAEVVQATAGDPALVAWDAELGGRPRAVDHAYWVTRRGGIPLWFTRAGRVIGYGYAQTISDDLLEHPDTLTLGPLGAWTATDTLDCLWSALRWARGRAELVRIVLPAPSPALAPLLEAGARIGSVDTFCLSDGPELADPRRYVPSGADLF